MEEISNISEVTNLPVIEDIAEVSDKRPPLTGCPLPQKAKQGSNALRRLVEAQIQLQPNIAKLQENPFEHLASVEQSASAKKFLQILAERKEELLKLSPEKLWIELNKIADQIGLCYLPFFEFGTFDRLEKAFKEFYNKELTTQELYNLIGSKMEFYLPLPGSDKLKISLNPLNDLLPIEKISQYNLAQKFLQILAERKEELLKLNPEELWNELKKIANKISFTCLPFSEHNTFESLKKYFENFYHKELTSAELYKQLIANMECFIFQTPLEK